MLKPDSLFNKGMKVLVYSKRRAEERRVGWTREGFDIAYYKNSIRRAKGHYYTLTYSITAECSFGIYLDDDDELYIASDYPYTYSDLLALVSKLCTLKTRNIIRKETLCKTLLGNVLPLLTLTNFSAEPRNRPTVVLTARVHPG